MKNKYWILGIILSTLFLSSCEKSKVVLIGEAQDSQLTEKEKELSLLPGEKFWTAHYPGGDTITVVRPEDAEGLEGDLVVIRHEYKTRRVQKEKPD